MAPKRKNQPKQPRAATPGSYVRVLPIEGLELRRALVFDMWGQSAAAIAEAWEEHGFSTRPRTAPALLAYDRAVRSAITGDRAVIPRKWCEAKRDPDEVGADREDHIAGLYGQLQDLQELVRRGVEVTKVKGKITFRPLTDTARINAYAEMRQIRHMIAKARGVDEMTAGAPEGDGPRSGASDRPFVGLKLDLGDVDLEELEERSRGKWRVN